MAFTSDIKGELSYIQPKCNICKKAMLSALIRSQGTIKLTGKNKYHVEFATDDAWIARFALSIFREKYNLEAILTFRRNVLHNSTNFLIELLQDRKLIYALVDLGILNYTKNNNGITSIFIQEGIKSTFYEKDCCSAAYLRGAFLGSGYVLDPNSGFHFEITVAHKAQAKDMQDILVKKNINAKICKRRNQYLLYIKSGQGISDFLAFTGGHKCALKLENIRVRKNLSNQTNRQTNADVANSRRSSEAAFDQMLLIDKVVKHYGLENLAPALQEFIYLRINNRYESLSDLGKLANPPLSKSALNGRLRRLQKMANEINK